MRHVYGLLHPGYGVILVLPYSSTLTNKVEIPSFYIIMVGVQNKTTCYYVFSDERAGCVLFHAHITRSHHNQTTKHPVNLLRGPTSQTDINSVLLLTNAPPTSRSGPFLLLRRCLQHISLFNSTFYPIVAVAIDTLEVATYIF